MSIIQSKRKGVAALSMCAVFYIPNIASAIAISGQGTWETTLQARDLDGNLATAEAYYDTVLGITWMADLGYFGFQSRWSTANSVVTSTDPYNSGIIGWRLPNTIDIGNDGCTYTNYYQGEDCGYNITTHSELSYMFYVTLGNNSQYDTQGSYQLRNGVENTGGFSSLLNVDYWSTLQPNNTFAWVFGFGTGLQSTDRDINYNRIWAVHDGDVGTSITASTVPIPAAGWLFCSGLLEPISKSHAEQNCI